MEFQTDHIAGDLLDEYALSRLEAEEVAQVEEHLLLCKPCRERVNAIDLLRRSLQAEQAAAVRPAPMRFLHDTDDGPILGETRRIGAHRWKARLWGVELDGGKVTSTVSEANAYLLDSFAQMFPDHRCGPECGDIEGTTPEWVASRLTALHQQHQEDISRAKAALLGDNKRFANYLRKRIEQERTAILRFVRLLSEYQ